MRNTSPNSLQISNMMAGVVFGTKESGPRRIKFEEKKEYLGYGREDSVNGKRH